MKISDTIYTQCRGFLRAGKNLQKPEDETDLLLSRIIGFLLLLLAGGIFLSVFYLRFLSVRLVARAVLIIITLLIFALKFYKGISIKWMWRGMRKYWIPISCLVYIFVALGYLVSGIFYFDLSNLEMGLIGGTLMIFMATLGMVSFFKAGKAFQQKASERPEDKLSSLVNALGSYLMALIWLAFFIGGLINIAWGTGVADWFFQNILGW